MGNLHQIKQIMKSLVEDSSIENIIKLTQQKTLQRFINLIDSLDKLPQTFWDNHDRFEVLKHKLNQWGVK